MFGLSGPAAGTSTRLLSALTYARYHEGAADGSGVQRYAC
jgi:hypothetical protein